MVAASPMKHHIHLFLFSLLFLSSLAPLQAQSSKIESGFSPNVIYPDQLTKYIIRINGKQSPGSINLPQVEGLSVVRTNSSQNLSFISGKGASVVSSYEYTIRADAGGVYTMPSFSISIDGREHSVPQAQLTVKTLDANRRKMLEERKKQQQAAIDQYVSLELSIPEDRTYYTGQAIPADITLYIHQNASLEQNAPRPEKVGEDFLTSGFSENGPQEQQLRTENGIYQAVTWKTILTPVKSGPQTAEFQFEIVVRLPSKDTRQRRRSPLDSFFGGGMFGRREHLILKTEAIELDIKPLPTANQPESFTGGIGLFSMDDPTLSHTQLKQGEPVTLTLAINGKGNFDRLQAPALNEDAGWRIYDPEEEFVTSDELGIEGKKLFKYTLIPQETNLTQAPNLKFSFFSPEAKDYIEFAPNAPQIESIIPALKSNTPLFIPSPPNTNTTDQIDAARNQPQQMISIRLTPGTWVKTLSPVFYSPLFVAGQSIPLAFILSLFFLKRTQLKREGSDYARLLKGQKETKAALHSAQLAANQNNSPDFYKAATRAIQETIGQQLSQSSPESLTLAEIEDYLLSRQADPDILITTRDFFESADALKFSGGDAQLDHASDRMEKLKTLIAALEKLQA